MLPDARDHIAGDFRDLIGRHLVARSTRDDRDQARHATQPIPQLPAGLGIPVEGSTDAMEVIERHGLDDDRCASGVNHKFVVKVRESWAPFASRSDDTACRRQVEELPAPRTASRAADFCGELLIRATRLAFRTFRGRDSTTRIHGVNCTPLPRMLRL